MRIIAPDLALLATLSCATANSLYPAANLITQLRGETLRTTGVSAQVIRATYAANQSVSAVALCRHNLTSAASWRVQLYSDAAWTTQVADSGTVTAFISTDPGLFDTVTDATFKVLKNSVAWFSPTTVRSVQITLTDAGNAAGYLEAARLFIGAYTDPGQNPDWGHTITWDDPTTQSRTLGRSLLSQNNGDRTRSFNFPFTLLDVTPRNFLFDLMRVHGLERDFFISMWPGEAGRMEREHQGWVKITAAQGFARPMVNYYGTSLTLGDC